MNLSLIEKSISIANGSLGLSAHLSTASREAPLLVLAHGFAGNKSENGLFSEASDFLAKRGFSILRFDFRGCGDSPGSFRQVRLSDLQTDLKSVLRFVHETDEVRPAAVGLIGFSLGAAVAILLRPRLPKVFVFWSPAIFTATDMFPRYQTREVLDQIREKGFFVKAGLEVSREFMDDLVNNEIEYSIRGMRAPVLLLHGEKDSRIPCPVVNRQKSFLERRSSRLFVMQITPLRMEIEIRFFWIPSIGCVNTSKNREQARDSKHA